MDVFLVILKAKNANLYYKFGFSRIIYQKIAFSSPKIEPKAPQDPIGTSQDNKNYFSEMPGYKNSGVEKRIFKLSPIEKKLV